MDFTLSKEQKMARTLFSEGVAQNLHRIDLPAPVAHPPDGSHGSPAQPRDQLVAAHKLAGLQIQRVQIAHASHPSQSQAKISRSHGLRLRLCAPFVLARWVTASFMTINSANLHK